MYIWKREEDASVFGMHYKNSTPDFSSVGRIGLFSISNYLISLVVIDANITPSARILCYASVNITNIKIIFVCKKYIKQDYFEAHYIFSR